MNRRQGLGSVLLFFSVVGFIAAIWTPSPHTQGQVAGTAGVLCVTALVLIIAGLEL